MRAQCVTNNVHKIKDPNVRARLQTIIHLDGPDLNLLIGKIYIVQTLEYWIDVGIMIYLHSIEESYFPYPYPIEMFKLLDSCLPSGWCVGFEKEQSGLIIKRITFPEWSNDANFYERLVDGDQPTKVIYERQRQRN